MNWHLRYSITDPARKNHNHGELIVNTIKKTFGKNDELGSRMINMIQATHRKDHPNCARCNDIQTGRLLSPYRQNGR